MDAKYKPGDPVFFRNGVDIVQTTVSCITWGGKNNSVVRYNLTGYMGKFPEEKLYSEWYRVHELIIKDQQ